ncbi:hypothetical protein GE061_010094 [Apolygus lucorum]|uniref:Uncharacterized protein n=1 Tax=Apolygus lucorum TaxID=248454 RepID=A0A8S9Y241_APOLU|nr:hypothetical protein GE061_010094 [Apolygus lucorum]
MFQTNKTGNIRQTKTTGEWEKAKTKHKMYLYVSVPPLANGKSPEELSLHYQIKPFYIKFDKKTRTLKNLTDNS